MYRFIPGCLFTAAIGFSSPALAAPIEYRISALLKNVQTTSALGNGNLGVGLTGRFRLDPLAIDPTLPVTLGSDLDLLLLLDLDLDPATAPTSVALDDTNTSLEFLNDFLVADPLNIALDGVSAPPGQPLMQIATDGLLPELLAFPNGRRVGDDFDDQIVLQLFRGSINLGFAAFDGGIAGVPGEISVGQVSPDNRVIFASAVGGPVAPVPLPAGVWSLLGALSGLAFLRGRRTIEARRRDTAAA